ncbi:hypothetical protein FBU30_001131 [Linnemannia zychae]|nr:hypothetical protein FBU30_001131 [Linnemannia zychae]
MQRHTIVTLARTKSSPMRTMVTTYNLSTKTTLTSAGAMPARSLVTLSNGQPNHTTICLCHYNNAKEQFKQQQRSLATRVTQPTYFYRHSVQSSAKAGQDIASADDEYSPLELFSSQHTQDPSLPNVQITRDSTSVVITPPASSPFFRPESPSLTFDNIWLRDNCPCPKCVHATTQKKLHSTEQIPQEISVSSIQIYPHGLEITWSKGLRILGAEGEITNVEPCDNGFINIALDKKLIGFQCVRKCAPRAEYIDKMTSNEVKWGQQGYKLNRVYLHDHMTKKSYSSQKRRLLQKRFGKPKSKLTQTFECLSCHNLDTVSCKLDFDKKVGILICKLCPARYACSINHLNKEVDVYSEWVDSYDKLKKPPKRVQTSDAVSIETPARAKVQKPPVRRPISSSSQNMVPQQHQDPYLITSNSVSECVLDHSTSDQSHSPPSARADIYWKAHTQYKDPNEWNDSSSYHDQNEENATLTPHLQDSNGGNESARNWVEF